MNGTQFRIGTVALLLLLSVGCASDAKKTQPVADTGAGAGSDAIEASGDASTDAGSGDGSGSGAPNDPTGCEPAAVVANPYRPFSCNYDVTQPAGITDLRSSCGVAGAGAAPQHVHLSFPSPSAATDVAVTWLTADDTRVSEVFVGTDPAALTQRFGGVSYRVQGIAGRVVHEAHLCGLLPDTVYYYRVVGEATEAVHSFTTAPASDSVAPFRFAVAGDTRSLTGNAMWGQASEQIAAIAPDFTLFSGDAVYFGNQQPNWDSWFNASAAALREFPLLPVNGNHEFLSLQYLAQFTLPNDEANYHFRYGNALFVMLNDYPEGDAAALEAGGAYLRSAMEANTDATWRIVVNHRAHYSSSVGHGSQLDVQEAWGPLIDSYHVDLVFNGHEHNYERTQSLRAGEVVPDGSGTTYVVSAGLGAELYDLAGDWFTRVSEKSETWTDVAVNGNSLTLTAHRLDGTVVDTLTLTK